MYDLKAPAPVAEEIETSDPRRSIPLYYVEPIEFDYKGVPKGASHLTPDEFVRVVRYTQMAYEEGFNECFKIVQEVALKAGLGASSELILLAVKDALRKTNNLK